MAKTKVVPKRKTTQKAAKRSAQAPRKAPRRKTQRALEQFALRCIGRIVARTEQTTMLALANGKDGFLQYMSEVATSLWAIRGALRGTPGEIKMAVGDESAVQS